MESRKKIAVFTGNRSEYGLQYPILKAICLHPKLEYELIVSGAHLDSNFGGTLKEIKDDGFDISAEIDIKEHVSESIATSCAIGSGIIEISKVLERLNPDFLLVYGDRFESFAAVVAATQMSIPTAHIEGGDLTEGGALDDSVRHAITKLSHLHFTTNEQATNRVLGMGEESWRVKTVGLPAIDMIMSREYATSEEVVSKLNLDLSTPIILFTFHSVVAEIDSVRLQIKKAIDALLEGAKLGYQVILTYPNNDLGGEAIIEEYKNLSKMDINGIQIHRSLGRYLYQGVLALATQDDIRIVCVGNSSSGIKESPAFNCPTVNIGSRQSGRLRSSNVLDVGCDKNQILDAINHCFTDSEFRSHCRTLKNPYFFGGAAEKIAQILADSPSRQVLLRKSMCLNGEVSRGWFR